MMLQPDKKEKEQEGIDLRGTLVSVGFLGLVIIVSWLGVWYLYLSR